eukprot:Skav207926  [mRNA]  locus=scaffold1441:34427:36076:+ [translate_table: standard]
MRCIYRDHRPDGYGALNQQGGDRWCRGDVFDHDYLGTERLPRNQNLRVQSEGPGSFSRFGQDSWGRSQSSQCEVGKHDILNI